MDSLNTDSMTPSIKEENSTDSHNERKHHNSNGKHHHHHHHHHSDDERQQSGNEHHHHHHHHHHNSDSDTKKYHKSDVKHKKKSLKSLFKKPRVSEKKKEELKSYNFLKNIFILILIFGLFFWSFYSIFIGKLSDGETEGELSLPTQTEDLKDQLSEAEEEINKLKEELAAYKEAFGELDLESKE